MIHLRAVAAIWPMLAAGAVAAAPVATAETVPVRYIVRPGDTLIALAGRALLRPGDWQAVARANRVADPRRLAVGRVLVIPPALLRREPVDATIAAFSGQVTLVPGGAAKVGTPVGTGVVIGTGANSFVTLALVDGSRITLPSQSRIRIAALDRLAIDGRLERRFELLAGRGDFAVTPKQRAGDRFLVKTPVAVAAVRGTEFRVAHDMASGRSTIGVVDGEVAGRPVAATADMAVTGGSGAVLGHDAARMAALLPAPVLLRPGRVQDEPLVMFEAAPGVAARYRFQLARDAGFVDPFAETDAETGAARFENIGNGTFYVRVTAIDGDGVEGLPKVIEFERFLMGLKTEAGVIAGKGPRRTLFRWQPSGSGTRSYDFVLARDAALQDRIVDAPGLAGTEMTVTGLLPGEWYWRVTVTARDNGKRHVKAFPVRTLTIARREN